MNFPQTMNKHNHYQAKCAKTMAFRYGFDQCLRTIASMGKMRNAQTFILENLKWEDHLQDLGADAQITVKEVLNK